MNPIDLTLTLSPNLPNFPGSPKIYLIPWNTIKNDTYNLELIFFSTHSGTHIDAPYHFIENGSKIHEIPVNRLVCNAILIKLKKEQNQSITKNDIIKFEKKHGKIISGCTIVFFTGWQKNIEKKQYFEKNPGLSIDAANYLITKKINLVGIDSPSIDLGTDSKFSVHKILAKNNVLIVENLANLQKIKKKNFDLVVLPLKLKGTTGSPVRAIAL